MADNIINLDDHRPHMSAYVACLECGKDWFAVAPADTVHFECPVCAKLSGVVVEPSSPEFLNAFFRGVRGKKENTKRTMVVLNAQRMIDGGAFSG
jgi:hypothetical protein